MTEAFMPGIKNINGHTYVKVQDLEIGRAHV